MIIPIKLSELIFKIYEGMNEVIFEKKEKSLLLKTSFNYALFVYLNGNNELALAQLELIKNKLLAYYEYNNSDDEEEEDNEESEEDNLIFNIRKNNRNTINNYKKLEKSQKINQEYSLIQ